MRLWAVLARFSKLFGLQVTGGSTSTVDAFDKMRLAGRRRARGAQSRRRRPPGRGARLICAPKAALSSPPTTRASLRRSGGGRRHAPGAGCGAAPAIRVETAGPRAAAQRHARQDHGAGAICHRHHAAGHEIRHRPHLPASGRRHGGVRPRARAGHVPGVEQVIDMGDGVAVVARNTWAAMEGARAVEVTGPTRPCPPHGRHVRRD